MNTLPESFVDHFKKVVAPSFLNSPADSFLPNPSEWKREGGKKDSRSTVVAIRRLQRKRALHVVLDLHNTSIAVKRVSQDARAAEPKTLFAVEPGIFQRDTFSSEAGISVTERVPVDIDSHSFTGEVRSFYNRSGSLEDLELRLIGWRERLEANRRFDPHILKGFCNDRKRETSKPCLFVSEVKDTLLSMQLRRKSGLLATIELIQGNSEPKKSIHCPLTETPLRILDPSVFIDLVRQKLQSVLRSG